MTRVFYFLSIVGINILFSLAVAMANVSLSLSLTLMILLIIAQLMVSMWRWENIGHNKWWGLLVIFPLVQFYGLVMPTNGKTNGLDTPGMVLLAVLVILFALSIVIGTPGVVDV
jgi:uncharacterized membrane protein YhaH (DUF805 family)